MIDNILTICNQILIMFLLMSVGFGAYKFKIINDDTAREVSSFIVKIVTPSVIISSYQRAFDKILAKQLLIAIPVCILVLIISIAVSSFLFKKDCIDYKDKRLCAVLSNNGFMALPLLEALFGETGIFLGSCHIVVTTIFVWSWGVNTLSKEKTSIKSTIKKVCLNPATMGVLVGLFVFISPFKLSQPIYQCISYLGSLNTPLAMIILGIYLAQSDFVASIKDKTIYYICSIRLIVIPAIIFIFLTLLPIDNTLRLVILIGSCTPVGVISAMFAQMYDTNYRFSSKVVSISTLLSAFTIPVFLMLNGIFS